MPIIQHTEEPVRPWQQLTNVEMLNLLEEIANQRLAVVISTYGQDDERTKTILNLFTSSFFVLDPHLSMTDEAIANIWQSMFERSRESRQFLIGVHTHFVTAIGQANFFNLLKDRANGYFAFKPETFFNENNLSHLNVEGFIEILKDYPWFVTFLLLGDILSPVKKGK